MQQFTEEKIQMLIFEMLLIIYTKHVPAFYAEYFLFC